MKRWLILVLFIAVAGCGCAPHDGDLFDGKREAIENDGSVSDALSVSRTSALDAPVIEAPGQGSLNGRYPLLSGIGIPGAMVQVTQSNYVNKALVSTVVGSDGRWTGRSLLELTPGAFSMSGRQTFEGKTSGWGLTRAFTIVEAPIAPVIENPLQSSLNGRYPLLSGTGIPGAMVQVMQSNHVNKVLVSTVVGADGRWADRSVLELPPGPFSMAGRQTLDGKTSVWGLTRAFTVLETPPAPVIESPQQDSMTGRFPWLSGKGIPGATVQVTQSNYANRILVSATVDAQGQWAARSALELPPGPFSMAGRQTLDGKTSVWGLTRTFTVVETPDAPVIENPSQGSDSGRYPWLSGKGIPEATVQVVKTRSANTVLANATVDTAGHWEALSALELPVGTYSIGARQTLDGKTSAWGANVGFTIVASTESSVFKVLEAPTGELNADTLGVQANVQVSYPDMASGDTVGIRLTGVTLRDAPIQTVLTASALTFYLPKAWITENLNQTVTLTYTYKIGGAGSLITSAPLSVKVVGSTVPGDGVRVANELNAQYSYTSNTCPNNKAAYECSGVLIRTVDDSTAFRAWNPSPYAVSSGGVSFSYMKVGIGMNRLQGGRTQGFVLEPGASFTANGGYPLQVLCSFPYDGHTLNRSAAGCGASANFPSNSGPCSAQGISTLATWRAHFQQYPATSTNRYTHQCSFAPNQASFALSLTARENPAGELAAWQQNEVIIKTWPQNTSNLPIKAFIYFSNSSRAVGVEGAKNIQRDFLKMTGRRIPVIRVTPNAATGNIFSYFAADQGI
jgi:hypothetical protein